MRKLALATAAALILGLTAGAASAAVIFPVNEDFDDDPVGSAAPTTQGEAWLETTESTGITDGWEVVDPASDGNHKYRGTSQTDDGNSWDDKKSFASLEQTGLAGNRLEFSFDFDLIGSTASSAAGRNIIYANLLADTAGSSGAIVFFFVEEVDTPTTGSVKFRMKTE